MRIDTTSGNMKGFKLNIGAHVKKVKNDEKLDPRIAEMKRWSEDQRRSQAISSIYNKMLSGSYLSDEELEYLRTTSPENYQKAVQIQAEREAYKKELENCKSKEDVAKLNQRKMNEFCSQAKAIVSNPDIPKAKKLELLDFVTMRMNAIMNDHAAFIKTRKYNELPDKSKDDRSFVSDENSDPVKTIQELTASVTAAKAESRSQSAKQAVFDAYNAYTKRGNDSHSHVESVKISISDEAWKSYFEQQFGTDYDLTRDLDLSSFTIPNRETLKTLVPQQERAGLPVTVSFMEGTVERYIFDELDGKAENAYQLAKELGDMIWGYDNEDVNSRAIDRQAAVKLAEYVAQKYLDAPAASSFLNKINQYAERAEMRDKGYMVLANSDMTPLQPKANALQIYAEKYHGYNKEEFSKLVNEDTDKFITILKSFQDDFKENPLRLSIVRDEAEKLDKAFADNANNVQRIIDEAKKAISSIVVNDSFLTDMDNFFSVLDSSQFERWNSIISLI